MGTGSVIPHRNITDVSLREGGSRSLVSYSNVWFTDYIKSRVHIVCSSYCLVTFCQGALVDKSWSFKMSTFKGL